MFISDEIKNEVRERSDIVSIIGEYVQLKKRGQNYLGLCPFHKEKTPSFNVNPSLGIYKCFGCGKSGDVFSFVADYHGMNFGEALRSLAHKNGIALSSETNEVERKIRDQKLLAQEALAAAAKHYADNLLTTKNPAAMEFLKSRDFTIETLKKFLIGYSADSWDETHQSLKRLGYDLDTLIHAGIAGKSEQGKVYDRFRGRVMFPIRDFMGYVIGFGARILSDDKSQAKYLNSPQTIVYDKSKVVYGIYEAKDAIRSQDLAIIVEGYADVMMLHQSGFHNAVAASGTALTDEQLKLISRYSRRVIFAFDSDKAGQNATEKALIPAIKAGFDVKIILMPEGSDPDSIIRDFGKDAFQKLIDKAVTYPYFLAQKIIKDKSILDINNSRELAKIHQDESIIEKLASTLALEENILKRADYQRVISSYLRFNDFLKIKLAELVDSKAEVKPQKQINLDFIKQASESNLVAITDEIHLFKNEFAKQLLPAEQYVLKVLLRFRDARLFEQTIDHFGINMQFFKSDIARDIFEHLLELAADDIDLIEGISNSFEINKGTREIIFDLFYPINQNSSSLDNAGIDIERNIKDSMLTIEKYELESKLRQLYIDLKKNDYTWEEEVVNMKECKTIRLRLNEIADTLNTMPTVFSDEE